MNREDEGKTESFTDGFFRGLKRTNEILGQLFGLYIMVGAAIALNIYISEHR